MKDQIEKVIIEQMKDMTTSEQAFAMDVLANLERLMSQELPF